MKKIAIKDEIYGRHFMLIYGCSPLELEKFLKQYVPSFTANLESGAETINFVDGAGKEQVVVWIQKKEDVFTHILDHELIHVVFQGLNSVGITHCKQSEEAFTYYYQYLKKKILAGIAKTPTNVEVIAGA